MTSDDDMERRIEAAFETWWALMVARGTIPNQPEYKALCNIAFCGGGVCAMELLQEYQQSRS